MYVLKLCVVIMMGISSLAFGVSLSAYLYLYPCPGILSAEWSMAVFGFTSLSLGYFLFKGDWILQRK